MSVIVADVGGTNVRFAVSSRKDSSLHHVVYLRCADFDSFESAYEAFLMRLPDEVRGTSKTLSLAVAGPVNDEIVEVSNNHWRIAKRHLIDRLALEGLLVINDFTAQALAQYGDVGAGKDHLQLLDGVAVPSAPLLVIGPGTGLGVSALVPLPDGPFPIEGEGGNVRFSPQTEAERKLDVYLREQTDDIVVENFVSGPGLETIYAFLAGTRGGEQQLSAERIGVAALAEDGMCRQSVNLMFGILGTVMADHVLTMGCWRGVVIAGGVTPRLAPLIASSPLRERFRAAGPMSHLLAKVPVWLSTDPDAGLKGARAALGNPHLSHRMVAR